MPEATNVHLNIEKQKEEDVDELDDVLEAFDESPNPTPPPPPPPQPPTATLTTPFNRPRTNTRVDAPPRSIPGSGNKHLGSMTEEQLDDDALSAEFAQELAKGMESLMKELAPELEPATSSSKSDAGATTTTGGLTEAERANAFKAAWEAVFAEGLKDTVDSHGESKSKNETASEPSTSSTTVNDFQNKIKQAMSKLQESELNVQSSSSDNAADPVKSLYKDLAELGLGQGTNDDEELAGFLEQMMGQLMTKDILYDPLKELADNFPGYLLNPPKPLEPEDRSRYEKQYKFIRQIIETYENPSYDANNAETNKTIMNLMTEMQACGSPPPEIMGPLPPGFENGLFDENCVIA